MFISEKVVQQGHGWKYLKMVLPTKVVSMLNLTSGASDFCSATDFSETSPRADLQPLCIIFSHLKEEHNLTTCFLSVTQRRRRQQGYLIVWYVGERKMDLYCLEKTPSAREADKRIKTSSEHHKCTPVNHSLQCRQQTLQNKAGEKPEGFLSSPLDCITKKFFGESWPLSCSKVVFCNGP